MIRRWWKAALIPFVFTAGCSMLDYVLGGDSPGRAALVAALLAVGVTAALLWPAIRDERRDRRESRLLLPPKSRVRD